MYDLISKSALRKELSKLPSRMGYVKKSEVMGILGARKRKSVLFREIEDSFLAQKTGNIASLFLYRYFDIILIPENPILSSGR